MHERSIRFVVKTHYLSNLVQGETASTPASFMRFPSPVRRKSEVGNIIHNLEQGQQKKFLPPLLMFLSCRDDVAAID